MSEITEKMSFIMNLWTVNTIISKRIDGKLGSIHGISFTEYMVLFHLKSSEAKLLRRIDLAQTLGLTASGVTRLLSPMEKIGLVEKETNKRDARVSLVKITSSGERILNDAMLGLEEVSNSLLQNVTNSSLQKSLEAFQAINSETKML